MVLVVNFTVPKAWILRLALSKRRSKETAVVQNLVLSNRKNDLEELPTGKDLNRPAMTTHKALVGEANPEKETHHCRQLTAGPEDLGKCKRKKMPRYSDDETNQEEDNSVPTTGTIQRCSRGYDSLLTSLGHRNKCK